MMDIEELRNPPVHKLRSFGLSTGAIVAVLFGVLLPWLWDLRYPLWPWIVLAVLGSWALIAPATLRLVYILWMRLGLLISKVTTPIILGSVFVVVFVPVSLLFRILRRDPMRRAFDSSVDTYRMQSSARKAESLEKPY